jgi:serine/threonine-protein kinase
MGDELAGTVVGRRYRLDRKLGEGGMGVVYSGFQLDLGRPVAVKLMTQATSEGLARFEREAHTAASLGNPHIVQVFDFQPKGEEPAFLVMELLNGPSLRQLIKDGGPLTQERAAHLFVQVLSALDAAHRAGIVHRDMKPANIVVIQTPTLGEIAKVLDFGIAKLTSPTAPALTQHGDIVGTMAYMSPEQAGGGVIDARSDIYSLGATLFHALTGHRPVEARTADELFLGIIEGRTRPVAQLRPDVDPRLAAIVERAIALDPRARFASAHEMADALKEWLALRVVPSTPPAVVTATSFAPPVAPKKKSSSSVGLVLLLVMGFFALVVVATVAVAGYFYVATDDVVASASSPTTVAPDASATPVAAPAATSGGPPVAPPAVVNRGASGPAPRAPANAGDAATAPPPAAAGCKVSADCGPGSWSCDNGKCTCASHLKMCGSVCTNTDLDGSNCGACGKTCSGGDICMVGACQACSPPMRQMCGGKCVFIINDNNNCGGCGIKCKVGKPCTQGKCPL